ncbi:hypothetical protein QGN29_04435 [Temperatibacter marinus]|uniref:Uncharacterized protein n=1 Tax=Temperatibacter marinus TaxID=1456591 RepID=A0AA52HBC4_9PROT|nr:hypothetical protein [Temperatibacter marinus]WND03620.1 hypothetical protein QGN29_04435 [Temperatibacter marinus]
MTRTLKVLVLKEKQTVLEGTFDVEDQDYQVVVELLKEITLTREGAEDLLIGYMHAEQAGAITEDVGKMALVAATYILSQGETEISIFSDLKPTSDLGYAG